MFSNPQNLVKTQNNQKKSFGIRVSLAGNDPFRRLLADDWETFHWFESANERNNALADMSRRHEYSRIGDKPTVCFEPVER